MNVKIQSKGIAGGQNTGSCGGYADYLEHENREKVESGMRDFTIPFFNPDAEPVSKSELVKSINSNTTQLHRDDAKFYSVILSFSDEEVKAMGDNREDILAGVHKVVEGTMDLYAGNFKCDDIRSHSDLKYYYTIHEYRQGFTPGLHVHVIVSRKDAANSRKISPMTNHRGGSSGVIKRGFDRDAFYRSCEQMFDNSFGFDRKTEKSYDYYNTMKHGSIEERETMIREVVRESDVMKEVNESILRYVEQLANESHVPEAQKEYMRQVQAQPKEKRTMNTFWNTYHSYYQPLLSSVKDSCNAAFGMYSTAKEEYGVCSEKISQRYDQLKSVYAEIDRLQKDISQAGTSKLCIKLFSFLIAAVNPAPVIILALVGCMVAESQKRSSIAHIRGLREHAREIRRDIENLKVKQEGLGQIKSDTLRQYIDVKDERQNLKTEIDTLKGMLEKSSSVSEETLRGLKKLVREGGLMKAVEAARLNSHPDFGVHFYHILIGSYDKIEFDLNLLTQNFGCEPVFHPNGGVSDFRVIHKGQSYYASNLFTTERMTTMQDKWETITGQRPAYKIAAEKRAQEEARQRKEQAVKQSLAEAPHKVQSVKHKL